MQWYIITSSVQFQYSLAQTAKALSPHQTPLLLVQIPRFLDTDTSSTCLIPSFKYFVELKFLNENRSV